MPDPIGLYLSDFGAGLDDIEPFTAELDSIVQEMREKLVNESKILEGGEVPEYGKGEWATIPIENELSTAEESKEQWKSDSLNGSSTTVRTPNSTPELNTSACIADLFNQDCPIQQSEKGLSRQLTSLCLANMDDSGLEIDAMNESSECMVPMISEQTDGMPNEEK